MGLLITRPVTTGDVGRAKHLEKWVGHSLELLDIV